MLPIFMTQGNRSPAVAGREPHGSPRPSRRAGHADSTLPEPGHIDRGPAAGRLRALARDQRTLMTRAFEVERATVADPR